MPSGFEPKLSELLGLRLLRAFQNLPSEWHRLQVVEYVEALNSKAETKAESAVRLVVSNLDRDEQNDHFSGTPV